MMMKRKVDMNKTRKKNKKFQSLFYDFFYLQLVFLTLYLLSPCISSQSSYFFQRIPTRDVDDDIEVYELVPQVSHQRPFEGRQSRRRNTPDVNHIISMLLTPLSRDRDRDDPMTRDPHEVNARDHSFEPKERPLKRFSRHTDLWPEGVIPFLIDRPLSKSTPNKLFIP